MNLLQGDHTTSLDEWWRLAAAIYGLHDTGIPPTIRTRGFACDSYNFRMIDVLGVDTSAEWYICGEDAAMISEYPITKREQSFTRSSVGDS